MARIVVLGAAGFLGSHLCDELTKRGDLVVGVDDLSSGRIKNISHLLGNKNFEFIQQNIIDDIHVPKKVDAVLNFASPASPDRYREMPLHTLRTGSMGTDNGLKLAVKNEARFIMASTSEVYGEPLVHPQPESYWGNVNSIGERSCYDEAKRYAEALCVAFSREHSLSVGIARIFNTYGPRLASGDGRVVSNFIFQALSSKPLTIYGDGLQTRCFCYVDDQVRGLLKLLDSEVTGPINIGSIYEITMLDLAKVVISLTGVQSDLVYQSVPADDPTQRKPDITLAKTVLGWSPSTTLHDGLEKTIEWFRGAYSF